MSWAAQGHSLGGSLATLLLMMYLRRGVLSPVSASPTYTFGAPAVFCEGDCASPDSCTLREPDGNVVRYFYVSFCANYNEGASQPLSLSPSFRFTYTVYAPH